MKEVCWDKKKTVPRKKKIMKKSKYHVTFWVPVPLVYVFQNIYLPSVLSTEVPILIVLPTRFLSGIFLQHHAKKNSGPFSKKLYCEARSKSSSNAEFRTYITNICWRWQAVLLHFCLINRTGVARAVLQTPLSFIKLFIHPFPPNISMTFSTTISGTKSIYGSTRLGSHVVDRQ